MDSVPVNESYPAARALSKLLSVMSNVDGERARVSGTAAPSKQTELVEQPRGAQCSDISRLQIWLTF